MPSVKIDQRNSTSLTAQFDFIFGAFRWSGVGNGIPVLASGQDGRRPHVFGHILRIVEGHNPAEPVMADILVKNIVVFMPTLFATLRGPQVAVAMWVHNMIGADQTDDSTDHFRVIKDLLNLWNSG